MELCSANIRTDFADAWCGLTPKGMNPTVEAEAAQAPLAFTPGSARTSSKIAATPSS